MAYNSFPIQVQDLALGSALQGQLDQNGLVATGSNEAIPAPVVATLGQVSAVGNVALQIEETVSAGNTWTSMLTSRAMSMGRLISSVQSYFFQVSSDALIWTDTAGDTTTLNLNKGATQLTFSNASVNIFSGSNALISSTDSTHMQVGNSNQALTLQGNADGTSVQGALKLSNQLFDGNASAGTAGQVLSSTGTKTSWISAGTGSINTVDTNSFSNTGVISGTPLQLESSVALPAGSYLVQYSVAVTFSPLSGAGLQETFMASAVSNDGTTYQGVSADQTVRNISGGTSSTFYFQSSAVVVLTSSVRTFGTINVTWIGGAMASVSAAGTMTSTLVNV
jgi:hypothetical protein